jgi:hypothetical protein
VSLSSVQPPRLPNWLRRTFGSLHPGTLGTEVWRNRHSGGQRKLPESALFDSVLSQGQGHHAAVHLALDPLRHNQRWAVAGTICAFGVQGAKS